MQIVVYVGLIAVGVLIAVLILIGVLDVVRGTPIRAVGLPGDPTGCPSIDNPFFSEAIELLTKVKLEPGHHIEIFINGDQTYDRLWADLRAAKVSITMQMYYCNKGRMADELQSILCERARAGVEVYFLFDSFGTSLPKEYFETLRSAGVHTTPFRPVSIRSLQKAQHRAHIRVVVVDGKVGYTGGFGIDDKWYGTGRDKDQWRDSNVRFTGPAVRQLQATFVVCWGEACGRLLTSEKLFPVETDGDGSIAASGIRAAILHASPTIGSTTAERFFVLSIAAARERLYLANSYFVPDKAFRQLLCDAAGRGVDVRILTTSKETDVKSTWLAGRARYEELFKGGVKIYEYQPAMMHAKTIVVDGAWMTVGSMNADNRSISFNEESNLVVLDKATGKEMEKIFLEDLSYSEQIDPVVFAQRPVYKKIAERACHLVWRVL
ncbi:MAG TPA: phospholipase D-like domain-containing protein [Gemmatimonadaceae bacterium]|jgi:cardiolipin synthase|nr:phospholipase D-like domain-containing protein [Gemmatimonadaceae bacterium]